MNFRLNFILILVLLLLPQHNSFAQDKDMAKNPAKKLIISSDMQIEYAQKLFLDSNFETAIIEYERFLYFFPGNDYVDQAKFNIGVCLFELKKFHESAQIFNTIILEDKENMFTNEAYFYQSNAFKNMGNMAYAQIVLQNYLKLTDNPDVKNRIYFYLCRLHLAEARESKPGSLLLAKNYLLQISDAGVNKYNVDKYLDLITKADQVHKKDPIAAGIFAIIPGGGFLYCNRYHDAFITLLLNTGLMFAAHEAYVDDQKALAGIIAFVEAGFYAGNIYGSISSAHKYNKAQTIKILNREFSIVSKVDPLKKSYQLSFNFEF